MKTWSRRQFLIDGTGVVAACAAAVALGPFTACVSRAYAQADVSGSIFKGDGPKQLWKWSREGYGYQSLDEKQVACLICPNHCVLSPGDRSVCRSKVNVNGKLYSLAYGNPCAVHIDPIEKKPLYHFAPRIDGVFTGRRRLQLPLSELPELGDLPGEAPRGAAP